MAKPLSAFLPEIALAAPGCATLLMEHAARESAIEFCNATRCVVEDLDAITVLAGATDVEFVVQNNTEIIAISDVLVDGNPIGPSTFDDLRSEYGDWQSTSGTPRAYVTGDNSIRLVPTPDAAVLVGGRAAVRPTSTASSVPDVLHSEWRRAIVDGALAWLLSLPGHPFSNPDMAGVHRGRFQAEQRRGQALAFKQRHRAPLRTHRAVAV